MILSDSYPPDIRVTKEAKSLVNAGHDVSVLCNRKDGGVRRETIDGINVIREAIFEGYGLLDELWIGGYYLWNRVNIPWLRAISDLYESKGFDALHVHDLPLLPTALRWAENRTVPVVADLHENWPEAKRQYRRNDPLTPNDLITDPKSTLNRIATPISRLKQIERAAVREADRVIAVTESGKRHYVTDCGADPQETFVVPNYVDLESFINRPVNPVAVDSEFVLLYIGTISGAHRGLEHVLQAMSSIDQAVSDPLFMIVGDGWYKHKLQRMAHELEVEDTIKFTGWIDFDNLPSYIAASDVCLVPHLNNAHTATTIPHKLTQYLAVGKPVIVTDVDPLQQVITDIEGGVVVPAGDSNAIAEAAIELYENPAQTAELGENGRAGVVAKYNWKSSDQGLLNLYAGLKNGRGQIESPLNDTNTGS